MTDTTTIQVTKEQANFLNELVIGSYKDALHHLIESYNQGENVTNEDVIARIDDLEAQLPRKVAEELQR